MQFDDFATLVKTRRSIRRYREGDVPDEMLLKAIDVATYAPNGGNRQPWQFWVIKNKELLGRMADAMDERSRLMASWPESEPYRDDATRWVQKGAFFRSAPAAIAVMIGAYQSTADLLLTARGTSDPRACEMAEWRRTGSSRLQTIGGAVQNLLLALHLQGLGACWMAGPQQAKGEIEEILGVTPEWDFVALVPVGWPAEEKVAGPRKPLEQVVKLFQ